MTVTLESLRKTIGKKKVNTQAFAWLADFEREAGDLDTSLQRIDGGLTMYPGDLAAHLVRTKILFEKGDYEGCIEECAKVLKMDPFCLSAQKRMGDAYDKVEKVNERNQCYRKVHDMDPLDQFWKDEYDVVVAATAAAASAELGEMDLSMPGLETQDADSTLDFSMGEDVEKEPKFDSGFAFENETPAAPDAEQASDTAAAVTEESAPSETNAFEALAGADDPFAALSALIPDSDGADEAAMDTLQASLDSAMESIGADEPSAPEVFPADDDISGSDVNSAMSNFFGVDDDLEPEEPAAPASPFSNLNLSAGIDDEPVAAANADKVFSAPAEEDKPLSVDDAFGSIFGEDELPEEPAVFQKSAEVDSPAETGPVAEEDKPQSVDDAFGSIFGEDELPEEPAVFQKSAEVDSPAEAEPAVAEPAPEDKPQSVDSAFNDIFGEDELPEEPVAFQKSAEVDAPLSSASDISAEPAAEELAEPAADELTLADDDTLNLDNTPVDVGDWSPFQKSAEVGVPAEEEAPAEESAPAEEETLDLDAELEAPSIAEPAAPAKSEEAQEVESSVDNAFSSIFGEDDDLPQEAPALEEAPAEDSVASAEVPLEETPAAEEPAVEEPVATAESFSESAGDFEKEMGGAFDSLFGSEEENTGAAVEEKSIPSESLEAGLDQSFDNLFGKEDDAVVETPAEETPAVQAETSAPKADFDNLESEVSGAFKGLFESDDDDLPEEKPSNKGVDFLMSGDSDDEVSAGLIKDPSATLDNVNSGLDESLNTRTLAEIYLEQGLCDKALEIYQDLAKKEPENKDIQDRLEQVKKIYNEKFGG